MGEETARLREEIDRTREDLTRDVDRLADKTSPSRIVERRVQRTRSRLVGLKEKVMGSSQSSTRSTYGPTFSQGTFDQDTDEGDGGVREHVADVGHRAQDRAQDLGHRAQDAVSGVREGVREQAEGNPLAAGVVAFGIGWLVSSLMPATDVETGAAQRAADVAREHGGPVVDQAKQAAAEIGSNLQDSAQEAAQQVKESAQDAAGTVREEARSSVSSSSSQE